MRTTTWRLAPTWALTTVGLSALAALASLAVPRLVGQSLDRVTTGGDAGESLVRLAAVLVVVSLCSAGTGLSSGAYAARVTQRLRARAIASVTDREARRVTSAGDLATRLLVDAAQPAAALGIAISITLAAATLVIGLVSIALIEWWVLVGLLLGLVALVMVVRRFVADSTPSLEAYRAGQARIADRALDAQRGAASIQAHRTWLTEAERVLTPLDGVRAAGRSLWDLQGRMAWRSGVFVPAALLVTVAVGGVSLARGRISAGELAALIGYTTLVIGSLDGIEAAAGLASVRVGTRRLAHITTAIAAAPRRGASPSAPRGAVAVTLSGASAWTDGTDAEPTVTDPVDLTVGAGRVATLSGPAALTGAVARLASGAATPAAGRVLVDGIPLRSLAPDAHVAALAGARPALLGDTVAGLLTIGLAGIDREAVRSAAAAAHIDHVIEALPEGYDTPLADLALSGGELQRLGIAQALLHGSGLLVLEEATSSLDSATELEVVRAVAGTRGQRTVLIASGRPALVAIADDSIDVTSASRCLPPARVTVGSMESENDDGLILTGEPR
ncbi:ATP-binding cassette subfamily B protein [Humibacillus xanthopallidus]|uniref:ATP-binding cassette subfamily B protein n=1 Tax=Humibacillus xanthopallidus TaxID=412689 RepID=A0A543PQA0_9MICO|nr:ABC transporter ATP-binding protein [Humibacillus xanthopallidus]TQN46225.1 ATP-binding cassette subfamily B protein [Humibacillus xanthopallidus]